MAMESEPKAKRDWRSYWPWAATAGWLVAIFAIVLALGGFRGLVVDRGATATAKAEATGQVAEQTKAAQRNEIAAAVLATLTAQPTPVPTERPTETPTATPTATATLTPTPDAAATAAALQELVLQAMAATEAAKPTDTPAPTATSTATPDAAATAAALQELVLQAMAATETARPTHTATPAVTSTPTPDAAATAAALQELVLQAIAATEAARPTDTPTPIPALAWPLILADPFASDEHGWPVEETDDANGRVVRRIVDGVYRWEMEARQGLLVLAHSTAPRVSDFFAAVEAEKSSGADEAEYGLAFREIDRDNFYSFSVRGGRFAVFRHVNGEWKALIDWTESDALRANQKNKLAVWAQGEAFTFFINDRLVGQTEDGSLTFGEVGLLAEVPAGERATFEFDTFELRASAKLRLPTPVATPAAEVAAPAGPDDTCLDESSPIFPPGELLACDSFSSSWNIKDSDQEHLQETRTVENGKFRWSIETEHGVFSQGSPSIGPVSDFYLSVQARQVGGPGDAERGLLFRKTDDDNLYTFSVREDGTFGVFGLTNGEWNALIGWRPSPLIQAGEAVRLTVLARGRHTAFFVNDEKVAESDAIPPVKGEVGLTVSLGAGTQAAFEFDGFELRTPANEQPRFRPVLESSEAACAHPSLLAPVGWPVVVCYSFDSERILNRLDWPVGDSSNEYATTERRIASGKYVWDVQAHQGVFSPAVCNITDPADFFLTVEGQLRYGPRDAGYGVLFRYVDGQNFYFFEVADNGYYQFAMKSNGSWEVLIPWTEHKAIRKNRQLNRLAVKAVGDQFKFYVNDENVSQSVDDRLKSGGLGLAIELFKKNNKGGFEWDHFGVWKLAAETLPPTATPSPKEETERLDVPRREEATLTATPSEALNDMSRPRPVATNTPAG